MKPKRVEVLGVPVDCVDMNDALDYVDELIEGDHAVSIIAVNPEKVIKAGVEPDLLAQLRDAGMLIPDGIGVVWAASYLGLGNMGRVPGSELMPAICERAVVKGYRVFLYGAKPGVNTAAVAKLRETLPGLQIVGHHHGYVSEAEMPALIEEINASGAQILFVALGSPGQELWMKAHMPGLTSVRVCQGRRNTRRDCR